MESQVCRGSLFSHQELSIATFLNIDVLAFQEKGVKQTDGLLQFLQTNCISFTDKHTLPSVVADNVLSRGWTPNWKNELVVGGPQFEDNVPAYDRAGQSVGMSKCFHVNVRNCHRDTLALNCCVYLESAIKRPDTKIELKTIEFKWAGTQLPSVGIAAGTSRLFDAFLILHNQPNAVAFQVHTDSSSYFPRLPQEAGEYELSYLVTSENFPPARGRFILDLRSSLAETSLRPATE
jgi:hypothetical protein